VRCQPAGILEKYAVRIERLSRGNVFLSADPASGTLLSPVGAAQSARLLLKRVSPAARSRISLLLENLFARPPAAPALIDLALALEASAAGERPSAAIRRSRVRFQGTDGIRGKIGRGRSELRLFFRKGVVVPRLFAAAAAAFIELALKNRTPSLKVAVAEDGRDYFSGRSFAKAVMAAIRSRGCTPVDLGILPTPLVPVYCALNGVRAGIVLTASHNPADQNGVKFFLDGRKILPDGKVSDYAITALAFDMLAKRQRFRPAAGTSVMRGPEACGLAAAAARAALAGKTAHIRRRGLAFIVDTAHGAYSRCAACAMETLGLPFEIINSDMSGADINRGSGVAVIEGSETFHPRDAAAPEIVRRLRSAPPGTLGIALDGDGDRGFVLVPSPGGAVSVLDGDRLSFLAAKYLVRRHGASGVFAGTVESDLALFSAVAADLALPVRLACVGDKYLSSTPAASSQLIGEETSGHVVIPLTLLGTRKKILAGNGLLSALLGAEALAWLAGEKPLHSAVQPYAPGVMKTFYVYFVDKSRLRRSSPAWNAIVGAVHDALQDAVAASELPASAHASERLFRDDRDMLYIELKDGGRIIGAVFTRASGTEDKIAVYARGVRDFEKPVLRVAHAAASAAGMLRDPRKPEAKAQEVLSSSWGGAVVSVPSAHAALAAAGFRMSPPAVDALLFAMLKQGIIKGVR